MFYVLAVEGAVFLACLVVGQLALSLGWDERVALNAMMLWCIMSIAIMCELLTLL